VDGGEPEAETVHMEASKQRGRTLSGRLKRLFRRTLRRAQSREKSFDLKGGRAKLQLELQVAFEKEGASVAIV